MKWYTKAAVLASVACLAVGFGGCGNSQPENTAVAATQPQEENVEVTLFVPNPDGSGVTEQKTKVTPMVAATPFRVLEAMIAADRTQADPVFKDDIRVHTVMVDKDGLAHVEMSKPFGEAKYGDQAATLQLQAIVKTLTDLKGIKEVTFTSDGFPVKELAGHDLSKPVSSIK